MKAVVTGATGFVGKQLAEELIRQGLEVTVIVRNMDKVPADWKKKTNILEASLNELSQLDASHFHSGRADIFFHMAWAGTAGKLRADISVQLDNIKYTCDAVALAKKLRCSRFVNAGSIMEYEAVQFIFRDGVMPGGNNIYSVSKLTADFMAKICSVREDMQYINVVISNIYGAGEHSPRFLNTILRKMLKNEHIALTAGSQLYDFIYITDAARAITAAGQKGKGSNSYYIGNCKQYPLKEFVIRMKEILESESELAFGEIPFQGMPLNYEEIDTCKMSGLGFRPSVSFEEGVLLTRDWILEVENEYGFCC